MKLGNNVKIQTGTTIGTEGLGFTRNKDGILEAKPFGNFTVVLEDDVLIGNNCVIKKGSWRDTVIGKGTKIASLCNIGHNVIIGKHCLIGAGVILCGSCEIGDFSEIWSRVVINQRIKVGKKNVIGACSYLNQNTGDNQRWYGVPAVKMT